MGSDSWFDGSNGKRESDSSFQHDKRQILISHLMSFAAADTKIHKVDCQYFSSIAMQCGADASNPSSRRVVLV